MRKFLTFILGLFFSISVFAQTDCVVMLDSVTITSFYANSVETGSKINYDQISRLNVGQEPSNIFKQMPSVFSLSDNGTEYGYGYFRIRGLDQTRINVSLDGCPWNEAEDFGTYFANSPDLLSSMQSVKVERGSSASYNGIAGVAGGINLETINVFENHKSFATIGGGSYNTFMTNAVYNNRISDKWGVHVRGSHSQTDGFRDYGSNNSHSFAFKIGYKFNDKHSIDIFSASGYHRNGQGWLYNPLSELTVNKHANGNVKDDDDEFFTTMNRVQYKGWVNDNVLLTSAVYWQHQNGSYRMDLDNYMYRMADPSWLPGTTGTLYDYALRYDMIGGNVAAKWFAKDFTFTVGVNAYNFNREHWLGKKSKNVVWDSENYDNTGNKFDVSAFVLGKYNITKKWSINANVQYRNVVFDYWDNINKALTYSPSDHGSKWSFVNWGIGTEYNFIHNKIYARFNYVNREPTRSTMFGGNEYATVIDNVVQLVTTQHEVARDVEIGIEGKYNTVKYNVNLFYMNFKNELVLDGTYGTNGLPGHTNANSSYRTGVEATVDWNMISNLHFTNNGSWSKNSVETETFGKQTHILSPSVTFNSDLGWLDNKWSAGVNWNYRSDMYVDMTNEHKIPARWTLNLYGSYQVSNVEFYLKINNITNRTNYCTGAVGANNETLYCRDASTNFMGTMKIYF